MSTKFEEIRAPFWKAFNEEAERRRDHRLPEGGRLRGVFLSVPFTARHKVKDEYGKET